MKGLYGIFGLPGIGLGLGMPWMERYYDNIFSNNIFSNNIEFYIRNENK